jgi:molybdenum cofactor guanylyltransferase
VSAEGFVLAGGRSRRMGRDKALVELAGRPLIVWALDALRQTNPDVLCGAGLQVRIAGARSHLGSFAEMIPDREEDSGPLGGICTALAATEAKLAVFLPVDLPLVPPELIAYLAWDATMTGCMVTLASVNSYPQVFPAVVRRNALAVLENELHNGVAGCFAGFQATAASAGEPLRMIAAESLAQTGHVEHLLGVPPARWFHNVNSPGELARAEKWLDRVIAQDRVSLRNAAWNSRTR